MPPHVRLANEIARQFAHRPPADAATAVANHMRTVWDPRMKRALVAHLDAGGEDLTPIARLAAEQLRATEASPAAAVQGDAAQTPATQADEPPAPVPQVGVPQAPVPQVGEPQAPVPQAPATRVGELREGT